MGVLYNLILANNLGITAVADLLIFDHKGKTRVEYWYIVTIIDDGRDISIRTQNLRTREQSIRSSHIIFRRLWYVYVEGYQGRFECSRGQRSRCGAGGTPRSLRRQEEREIGLRWFVKLSAPQFCRFRIHTTMSAITIPCHEISPANTRGVWRATNRT